MRGNPLLLPFIFLRFSFQASISLFSLQSEYGQNNTTAFLTAVLGNHTALIKAVELEYSLNSTANGWPITDAYHQISAIYTDAVYQCPLSIVANDSLSAGIPTWRFLYNATFADIMPLPKLGVFHRSESMTSLYILCRLFSVFDLVSHTERSANKFLAPSHIINSLHIPWPLSAKYLC